MRWDGLADEACSLARTVSVVGDRWTLLILRDCFLRVRRFEDFQARLGITRPLLGIARYSARCRAVFHPNVPTRPSGETSRSSSTVAIRRAWSSTSA